MKEQIGVMLSSSEVENRISEMAAAIDKAYEGKTIHLIGILKGSVFFMCELAKRMKSPVTMDFMSVSSYGDGTKSPKYPGISPNSSCPGTLRFLW